jgi:hypothetical protein
VIEVVEKAFVDIVIEQSFEKDCLLVTCRRTNLRIAVSHLELMQVSYIPSPSLRDFPNWIRTNFLNKRIYAALKP